MIDIGRERHRRIDFRGRGRLVVGVVRRIDEFLFGFALGREFVNRLVGSRFVDRLFGRDVRRVGFGNGPVVPVRLGGQH